MLNTAQAKLSNVPFKTLSAPFPPRDAKHAEDITMQPLGYALVMIPILVVLLPMEEKRR